MDDLFDKPRDAKPDKRTAPLAERVRPKSFERFVGQEHILGAGKPLRKLIEEDSFGSLILWGPPGSGKTTLARIASNISGRVFHSLSAVESGVKELKEAVKAARFHSDSGKKFVLFIDEIHRYNKTQQDALLPHVESGLITLIGTTTENPSFSVIPALRSRCRVVELRQLSLDETKKIVHASLSSADSSLDTLKVKASEDVIDKISLFAAGDARIALSLLEECALAASGKAIDVKLVEEISQKANLLYDRAGQAHYDHASAFQKSLRGSDPDAAIYWMGRMLEAGEDARFIARRLIVTAAEDVGNADPTALILAIAAAEAVDRIGLPEGRIPLAQAVLYVASAPKSNAAKNAVDSVLRHLREKGTAPAVPNHLRDTSYKDAKKMGHGEGYRYAHDYKDHYIEQDYLPDVIKDMKFYSPSTHGREAAFAQRLKEIKERAKKKTD